MTAFLTHLLLVFIWVTATGDVSGQNLLIGFILGYVVMVFVQRVTGQMAYTSRVWKAIVFVVYFIWELIKANIQVAYFVFMPTNRMKPGVVAIPLRAETDVEITSLSNFITLTPGSLGLDVSDDQRVLYIHALNVPNPDIVVDDVKRGLERRLLEVLR
jgi:multicomponent Na+:H+ antiporter subunit E